MIWFTSDLHLGHAKVIEFCNRPFRSVEEMDATLVKLYNTVVKPDDEVWFLGDVSFHVPSIGVPILKSLPGKKVLILGNHDKYSRTQYHDAGFSSIMHYAEFTLRGRAFQLSHFPYAPKEGEPCETHDLRYLDRRPPRNGRTLLCGHVHEKWKELNGMVNVGVDVWDFMPVPITRIERLLSERKRRSAQT